MADMLPWTQRCPASTSEGLIWMMPYPGPSSEYLWYTCVLDLDVGSVIITVIKIWNTSKFSLPPKIDLLAN